MNISKLGRTILTGAAGLCFLATSARAEGTVIKFATLAPEGSTWMKVMNEWNQDLIAKSGGKLRFRIYSGGVSGDEKDVVRKIRLGQLQAGGFTGVGLGEIAPEVRILDTPFLAQNSQEADYLYQTFDKDFRAAFDKKGYVFLGWAEVGFIYFFTQKPVRSLEDLRGVKMWMWEGDPIAEATFKTLNMNAVPLSVEDVLTSLQTKLVNGVYSSPLAAIALQWYTHAKYMYGLPLANASGAALISKAAFDRLPKDQQELLLSTGKAFMEKLTAASRRENQSSIEALKKNGIAVTPPPDAKTLTEYRAVGEKARKALVGRLYSPEFLDKIEGALKTFRAQHK